MPWKKGICFFITTAFLAILLRMNVLIVRAMQAVRVRFAQSVPKHRRSDGGAEQRGQLLQRGGGQWHGTDEMEKGRGS